MEERSRSIATPDTSSQNQQDFSPSQEQGKIPVPARDRRKPRISETPPAAPPAPKLADYEPIIGKSQLDELRFVASALRGKRVKMVNSTAVGGGVAEMLNRLVPLLDELEIKTGWEVITGG